MASPEVAAVSSQLGNIESLRSAAVCEREAPKGDRPSVDDRAVDDAKRSLRRAAKANRRALVVDHDRVCVAVRRFLDRHVSGWVVTFDAMPGEPDLGPLFADVPERMLALTRTPTSGHDLSVHDGRGPREPHRFGYEQPTVDAPIVPLDEIGVVLVPGLAFDRDGGRLGFGAGYYDRFLARLSTDVARVGVSDGFIVGRVPTGPLDIAMTHLATEAGVVRVPLAR